MITTFLNDTAMDRFQNMQQTTKLLSGELRTFSTHGFGLDYSIKDTSFLEQKLSNKPIRAYFVSKIGEWLMAERRAFSKYRNEEELNKLLKAQLPFVFETIITIQYLHNQILDAKAGVVTRDRISDNLLTANLLKDQLYRYIRQELPPWAGSEVERSVRKCFEYVDLGQILEIRANRYHVFADKDMQKEQVLPVPVLKDIDLESVRPFINKLKADLPVFLHQQLDVYFHRIYLTCAALFVEASSLIGGLLQLPAKKIKPIVQFSTVYGLMRQLVNDNADWIPGSYGLSTTDKAHFDGFSDLRNATLTLPLIFFLAEQKNGLLHDVLSKNIPWESQLEQKIFDDIIKTQALYKSIQNTRVLGELALAYLPSASVAATYLGKSCDIVHWNKFLVPCLRHPAYKIYRQTTYCKQTKHLIKVLRKQRTLDQQAVKKTDFPFSIVDTLPLAVQHLHQLLNKETASPLSV